MNRGPLRRAFNVAAVFIVALYLAPIYWIVLTSIKPTRDINSKTPVWDFTPTLEHYAEAFGRFEFDKALLNSGIIVLSATFITMILALMSGYALARMKLKGADTISLVILSLRFMPGVVIAMPYYLMFQNIGLIDTHIGMIIIYVAYGLPFAVWLMRGFLLDLPREIEEAARIDGLGWLGIIWRIILPLSGPGIAVTAIFTFVFNWNEFLFALYYHAVGGGDAADSDRQDDRRLYSAVGNDLGRRGDATRANDHRRVPPPAPHDPRAGARGGEVGAARAVQLRRGARRRPRRRDPRVSRFLVLSDEENADTLRTQERPRTRPARTRRHAVTAQAFNFEVTRWL